MGMIIRFPLEERIGHRSLGAGLEPATVVILPVVRIERHGDEPSGECAPTGKSPGRGRRRRATPS
jgi:hypothetical protein